MNIDIKPDSSPEAKHIHEGFRGVLELSPQERVRFLYEPRWIGYARAKLILDDMAALLRMPRSHACATC